MIKPLKSIHIIIQHFIIRYGQKIDVNSNDSESFYITVYELKSKLSIRIALYNLNCYQDAIQCNDQAIKIDPKYRDAFYNKDILILQFYILLRQYLILVVSLRRSYRRLRSDDQNVSYSISHKGKLAHFIKMQIRQHTCKCFRHEEQS
ncbi:unnamed protein product [Paramecium primaurelia]|uniref:Tetratricopeptide repeat protein n=1 Tax=Paramecium primaurelia TaxID=5886 RepID=A0A8S1PMI8_PARPR|nr:unnamed protein product [Paramecium primaurelia]